MIWICVKLDLKISLFFVESDSTSHLHLDLNQQMLRLSCILNTKPEIDQIWNGVYLAKEYFVSCIPLHVFYTRKCVFLTRNMTVVRSLGKLSGSPPVASDQSIVTGVFIDFRWMFNFICQRSVTDVFCLLIFVLMILNE